MGIADQGDPRRIFVYGLLRKDAPRRAPRSLTEGWTFEGYGTVGAKLYDLGRYPGARPSSDPEHRVLGELHRLPDTGDALRRLDRYEGATGPLPHAFERDTVEVEREDGDVVTAWIYWYRGHKDGVLLPDGDWADVAAKD